MIKNLNELINITKQKKTKILVVAPAHDIDVLSSINKAFNEKLITPILIGNKQIITKLIIDNKLNFTDIEIINCIDDEESVQIAIDIINKGKADILMKGLISTGKLLKKVLIKENKLLNGKLLSHVAIFESPYYHKIFAITDVAMNITPDVNEKAEIIKNAVNVFHKLGIKQPKVGVVCPVETVNPKMQATVDASMLTLMNKRNQITGCIVDGPLALDNIISKKAAEHKNINSKVSGDVDIILVPEINTGNVFYKSLNFLGGANSAAIITGAKIPIVLTSRADDEKSKFLSITLAAAI